MKKNKLQISTFIVAVVVMAVAETSLAESWDKVSDESSLRTLFDNTKHTATLKDGVEATATYNSDGSGTLKAWGASFERQWKVDNSGVCLNIDAQWRCLDIERNTAIDTEYRASERESGRQVLFNVEGSSVMIKDSAADDAGGAATPSADEISKQLANPNTPLATLTMKTQFRGFKGSLPDADNQNSTTILLQPSFPFPTDGGGVVYFRPGIPLLPGQPVPNASGTGFDSENALGDIAFDLGYGSTNKETGLLLAYGMVSSLPTATEDSVGSGRYTIGPEMLVGLLRSNYVLGAFPNHQWSVGGSNRADVNLTTVQLFGIGLLGGGWSVGTAPIITYNWETDQATIPLQLDISKTVIWSGRPWKLGLELNYYVEQADAFGPEWMISFNIAPVVENMLASWF